MKEKMKILVVEPAKRPYVKEIDHTLEEMQKVVGGSIQALYPFEDLVGLICNDEAKILPGFLPNRALRDEDGNVYDIICQLPTAISPSGRMTGACRRKDNFCYPE